MTIILEKRGLVEITQFMVGIVPGTTTTTTTLHPTIIPLLRYVTFVLSHAQYNISSHVKIHLTFPAMLIIKVSISPWP